MTAEPPPHLFDRRVGFGHTPRAQDERVLTLGQKVHLRRDLEVRESAPEVGVLSGEDLVLAVEESRRGEACEVGGKDADLWIGGIQRGVLQPCAPEYLEGR